MMLPCLVVISWRSWHRFPRSLSRQTSSEGVGERQHGESRLFQSLGMNLMATSGSARVSAEASRLFHSAKDHFQLAGLAEGIFMHTRVLKDDIPVERRQSQFT